MSNRLYWTNIRNTASNVFRPLQPTYYWSVGRGKQHLREEHDESDQRVESSVASESDKSDEHCGTTCHRNRDTACSGADHCHVNACKHRADTECTNCTCDKDGDLPSKHGDSCTCPSCRDYNEYTEYISTPKRERFSSRIRPGDEFRITELSDCNATDPIEHITGIQSGVTI